MSCTLTMGCWLLFVCIWTIFGPAVQIISNQMFGRTWQSSFKHLQTYPDDYIHITIAISKLNVQSLNPSSIQKVLLHSVCHISKCCCTSSIVWTHQHRTAQIDGYVHRIGRCGRAGRKGTAVTFAWELREPTRA